MLGQVFNRGNYDLQTLSILATDYLHFSLLHCEHLPIVCSKDRNSLPTPYLVVSVKPEASFKEQFMGHGI